MFGLLSKIGLLLSLKDLFVRKNERVRVPLDEARKAGLKQDLRGLGGFVQKRPFWGVFASVLLMFLGFVLFSHFGLDLNDNADFASIYIEFWVNLFADLNA